MWHQLWAERRGRKRLSRAASILPSTAPRKSPSVTIGHNFSCGTERGRSAPYVVLVTTSESCNAVPKHAAQKRWPECYFLPTSPCLSVGYSAGKSLSVVRSRSCAAPPWPYCVWVQQHLKKKNRVSQKTGSVWSWSTYRNKGHSRDPGRIESSEKKKHPGSKDKKQRCQGTSRHEDKTYAVSSTQRRKAASVTSAVRYTLAVFQVQKKEPIATEGGGNRQAEAKLMSDGSHPSRRGTPAEHNHLCQVVI